MALLTLAQLPLGWLQAMSLIGGGFLLYQAVRAYRISRRARLASGERLSARGGLLQGLLARALTPHAYLFWFLVGAPLLLQASPIDWLAPPAFLVGYYCTIVGSNVVIAVALQRCAGWLSEGAYRAMLGVGSLVLAAYGLGLLASGLWTLG